MKLEIIYNIEQDQILLLDGSGRILADCDFSIHQEFIPAKFERALQAAIDEAKRESK